MEAIESVRQVVLLVGRSPEMREFYANALRLDGLDVDAAADVISAARMLRAEKPPSVIVAFCETTTREDCLMFCERVHADSNFRSTPILLPSMSLEDADLRLATHSGAVALVVEPDDATKLVAAVRGVLAARDRDPHSISLRHETKEVYRAAE